MAMRWNLVAMMALSAVVVRGQAPRPEPITVTGCVNRVTHNGSVGGIAGAVPATPANAGTLANTQEPTGAFILNGAEVVKQRASDQQTGRAPALPAAYVLMGHEAELERHVGHRVEILGRLLSPADNAPPATKSNVKRIDVASLRMLASACPVPAPPTP